MILLSLSLFISDSFPKSVGDGIFGFGTHAPVAPIHHGTATVDQVMFWNRELNAAEVMDIYNAQV